MKKLINDVANVLPESLDGFAAAHADLVLLGEERKFIRRKSLKPGKVALISGGGWGTSRFMAALSAMACSTPPARARSSPRPHPTR